MKSILFNFIALSCLSALTSCSSIATFDQAAYANATSLKVDSHNLIGQATAPYANHQVKIRDLQTNLDKAYEYDKGRPKNEITVRQWEILRDSNRDLLGGFIKEWKATGPLKPKYILNKQTQIDRAFDTIIGLESGKIKPSEVK